jgi:hypothetical protein
LISIEAWRDHRGSDGMAERTDSTIGAGDSRQSRQRAKTILGELVDAAMSAALSAVSQHKERHAQQVVAIAEAAREAARSLERSQSPMAARYADRTADQIDEFSRSLRESSWVDLLGDVENSAHRHPALFVVGAIAAGFLAGRFLTVAPPSEKTPKATDVGAPSPDEAIAAAVSSAAGNGALAGRIDKGSKPREARR